MKTRFNIFFLILLGLQIVISCGKKPFSVLDREEMADVVFDLYIADAMSRNSAIDMAKEDAKIALANSVLQKHGITRAVLDSSLVWYSDNMQELSKVNDLVTARLSKIDTIYERKMVQRQIYKAFNFEDKLPRIFYLDTVTPSIAFRLDSIRLSDKGMSENAVFSFDVLGLDTTSHWLQASMYYHLSDTVLILNDTIVGDSSYVFSLDQFPSVIIGKQYADSTQIITPTDSLMRGIIAVEAFVKLQNKRNRNSTVILNNIKLQAN